MPQIRFDGPCVVCSQVDPSGYYKKQMCNNCYRKVRRLAKPKVSRAYPGPCVICGSLESSNGRFVKKLCHTCYSRLQKGGGEVPRAKYNGPCIECGKMDDPRYYSKLCNACYKRGLYDAKVRSKKVYCIDCNEPISRITRTGRCIKCQYSYRYATDPSYREGYKRRHKAFSTTDKGKTVNTNRRRTRRANKLSVFTDLKPHEWLAILEYYNYTCAYCGVALGDDITQDHVIPISKGGPHTASNVVPACRICNCKKKDGPAPKEVVTLSFHYPQ